jgi:para-nitrobenzyl esterase
MSSALACAATLAVGAEPAKTDPLRIKPGLIQGAVVGGDVQEFKGIPFAAPPVGNLRWREPQPVEGWEGVRECLSYGPACPQPDASGLTGGGPEQLSEDCLYLNVWTPAGRANDRMPVMMWIHGGGFSIGSGSTDVYNGQELARRGAVVVTINRRLGPFGFFAHPRLIEEAAETGESVGNYGFLDKVAALEWIRDNISAFGGDPGRVTIFGESGGARSVAHLMVSPPAKGLFHRAILQSSSLYRVNRHLTEPRYGQPSMVAIGEKTAELLGCHEAGDPLKAMRAKSADEVLEAGFAVLGRSDLGNAFSPVVDGRVFPDNPTDLLEAGRQHDVPMIAGSNANEGAMFIQSLPFDNPAAIRTIVRQAYPDHADEILELFPVTSPAEARASMDRIIGDPMFTAAIRSTLRAMEKVSSKAYQYYFTRVRPDERGERLGAAHGDDIRFVFDNLDMGGRPVTDADRALSGTMADLWVRFAATGDPNGPGLPEWPAFDSANEKYLELGDEIRIGARLRPASCDLFAGIEAERRANRKPQ